MLRARAADKSTGRELNMNWRKRMETELKLDWQQAQLMVDLAERLEAVKSYYLKYRAYLQQRAYEELLRREPVFARAPKFIHSV